ncbi:MAG: hypothetical protein JWO36_563 [Myxococcales bacterium]|nr:hypothetical protein [Myxococcales bacterium]
MKRVFEALDEFWVDPELHRRGAPATAAQIAHAEATLGRALPSELAELYRYANGFALYCGTDSLGQRGSSASGDSAASPFRLFALDQLHTFASTLPAGHAAIAGWTAPKHLADAAWADSPDRIRAFDLTNSDYVSWVVLPDSSVRWIDDWSERPQVLATSLAALLHRALPPTTFGRKDLRAALLDAPKQVTTTRPYRDDPGSPAHVRAGVAMRHEDYEPALVLARAGRKGDAAFRALCDVLVLELLAKLGDLPELRRETTLLRETWSAGTRGFVHPDLWRRVDEVVTARIPEHPDLPWIRTEHAASNTGDFM